MNMLGLMIIHMLRKQRQMNMQFFFGRLRMRIVQILLKLLIGESQAWLPAQK